LGHPLIFVGVIWINRLTKTAPI